MSEKQLNNSVADIADILRKKYAIFTGGYDRELRSLITFPDVGCDTISDDAICLLMQYFSTLAPCLASNRTYAAVIDRRGSDWLSVKAVLKNLTTSAITIDHVYILKPQGFLQKWFVERKMNDFRHEFGFCMSFADTVKELNNFIDPEHLPSETGGIMTFDIENWIRDRLKIEAFRSHVQLLCQREEELRLGFGKQSPPLVECISDQPVHVLNAAYLPPMFEQSKRLRRQWLDAVSDCEATGLQLRHDLLDQTSESSANTTSNLNNSTQIPTESLASCGTDDSTVKSQFSKSTAFDLPVDRIFEDINLTHLLLNLTEARTRFSRHWRQVIKRAKAAKLLREVERRFYDLHRYSDIWENLLESAAEYQTISRNQDNSTGSPALTFSTHWVDKKAVNDEEPESQVKSLDGPEGVAELRSGSGEFASTTGPEGLEAVVSRLTEAEQFAGSLMPDLEWLACTTDWLIANIPQLNCGSCNDVSSRGSTVSSLPPQRTAAHLESSSSDSTDQPVSSGSADSALTDSLPALRLPLKATAQWPVLFNRLIDLARVELPRAVDQLNLLVQLHSEINNARSWCSHGRSLVKAVHQSFNQAEQNAKVNSLSLSECQARLDELNAFRAAKETTLEVLTDPRMFRLKFSPIMNPELNSLVKDLLCSVDEVESSCQAKAAELRQQISRLSFPRQRPHTNSSTSLPPARPGSVEGGKKLSGSSKSASPLGRAATANRAASVEPNSLPPDVQANSTAVSPARRYQLAWEELVETERSYVNFLHHVYQVVWPVDNAKDAVAADDPPGTPAPPAFMRDHPSWLLVNWPDLVTFHQEFLLPTLEACSGNAMKLKQWALQVAPRLTDLYSVYCSLHDSAVQVACHLEKDRVHSTWLSYCNAEVHRRETQSPLFPIPSQSAAPTSSFAGTARPILQFSSRLVTPVQRFQRYHLLLHRLVEMALIETSREDLKEAHKTMLEMCEVVNLAMRFYGLSTRPSELGRLLLRADFSVSRTDSKAMSNQQCHVFLFTNTILLTKFRLSPSSTSPVLPLINAVVGAAAGGGGGSPAGSGDLPVLETAPVRSHSNQSLSSLPLHPSSLLALAKSHVIGSGGSGSNNSLTGAGISTNDSRPVYEVKEVLPLAQIGLTPNVRADRRRFAIWTANRAQTYVFQSSDPSLRGKWVSSINDLLMDQLRRLRDEALRHYLPQAAGSGIPPACAGLTPTRIGYIAGVNLAPNAQVSSVSARSSSLPISSNTVINRNANDNDSILSLPLEQHKEDS